MKEKKAEKAGKGADFPPKSNENLAEKLFRFNDVSDEHLVRGLAVGSGYDIFLGLICYVLRCCYKEMDGLFLVLMV